MHIKLLLLFSLVSVVRNHDVSIGSDGGRLIFEDTRFASPAIWRQVENVTVIAPENEVISKVNITDMRADKDGDVDIVNGGKGEKSVTIEIKSPTVLRGYEFHIEVFSIPESNYKTSENKSEDMPEDILNYEYKTTAVPQSSDSESSETNKDIPTSIAKDSDIFRPSRQTSDDVPQTAAGSETNISSETLYKESTTTENNISTIDTEENNDETSESVEGSGSDQDSAPVISSDSLRPARGADSGNDFTEMPVENEATITTTETLYEDYTTIEDILIPNDGVANHDSTTEALEVFPEDSKIVRPARETNNENESTVTTTETLNTETTEGSLKANDGDNTMSTPNSYGNTKITPDYSAQSILDYIKNKEQGNRHIRRTEEKDTSDTQSSDEEQNNENEDSSSTTEGPNSTVESNDTVDLLPPEVDAPYSDNFSPDLGSTVEPIESSTSYTHSRKARRYELPDSYYDAINEHSTTMSENTTTESSLEEKSRNSRNTEDNLENSYNFNLTSEAEPSDEPNSVATKDHISSGIVILKEDSVIIKADGKQIEFTVPIVLIIGNDNNFPIFKLLEDSADTGKVLEESKISLDDTPVVNMDYEVREAANDFAKNDEYSY